MNWGFDRSILDSYQTIRPLRNSVIHARIPSSIFESGLSAKAICVYAFLRSKPPIHRWNASTVHHLINKHTHRAGRGVVEKSMAELNREGYIRYVDLVLPSGELSGSIVEVQADQLPVVQRGKKRRVKISPDSSSFTVFEADGSVVDPIEYSANAREMSRGEKLRPLPQKLRERKPQERSPEDRERREQYKGNQIQVDNVEESPKPLSGKGDLSFDDFSGDSNSGNTSTLLPDYYELISKLILLGKEKNQSAYEKLLGEEVFPALPDPPPAKRWDQAASIEYCSRSIKAEILLQLSSDSEWNGQLARSFAKGASRFSTGDFELFLLGHDWSRRFKFSLSELVKGGRSSEAAWSKLLSAAKKKYGYERLAIENWRDFLDQDENESIHSAQNFVSSLVHHRAAGLVFDDSPPCEKFEQVLFLQLASTGRVSTPLEQRDLDQLAHKLKNWRQDIADHIVSNKTAARVFSSLPDTDFTAFGFNPQMLIDRHVDWLERTNRKLRLFRIETLEGFSELFDSPPKIDLFPT